MQLLLKRHSIARQLFASSGAVVCHILFKI